MSNPQYDDEDVPEEERLFFYALQAGGAMFALPKSMSVNTSIQRYHDECAAAGITPKSFELVYTDVLLSQLIANMDAIEANNNIITHYFAIMINDLVNPSPSQFGDDLAKATAWYDKLRKPPFNFKLIGPIATARMRTEWTALLQH